MAADETPGHRHRCHRHIDDTVGIDGTNLGNETISSPVDRTDDALRFSAVTDSLARFLQSGGERRLGNDPILPQFLQQFFFRDHSIAVLGEIREHIEYLRLYSAGATPAPQLEQAQIELEVTERV